MDCTRESPELTLKSVLGAVLSKIMDEVGRKWKMVALLHKEENREQRCECGVGNAGEKKRKQKKQCLLVVPR